MSQKKQTALHCFRSEYDPITRVLYQNIKVSKNIIPPNILPTNELHSFKAIWDTGATNTVITENVAKKCNLKIIDMVMMSHGGGEELSPVYLVGIHLKDNLHIYSVRVTQGKISGADVLIGMDIITLGDFAITNTKKKTLFSFRIPSIAEIDFIKEGQARSPKIRVNDPCPCGSGIKYKKCHGRHHSI